MNSICEELARQNISSIGGENPESDTGLSSQEFDSFEVDLTVKAVLVGLDTKFTYFKLQMANLYIQTGGAKFFACNDDPYDMINGLRSPGAGAMINAIQSSLNDGEGFARIEGPTVLGKPNPYALSLIRKDHNVTGKVLMVGDRMDTDVLFGNQGDASTLLVMTGCTTSFSQIEAMVAQSELYNPTYVLESLDTGYF